MSLHSHNSAIESTRWATIDLQTHPDYPASRLVSSDPYSSCASIDLPDGPWSTGDDKYPTLEQRVSLLDRGYTLDRHGRPTHPNLRTMLADRAMGVVTNKGVFRKYQWGPNYTGDLVVITDEDQPKALLLQRVDNLAWASAGGFVSSEDGETIGTKSEVIAAGINAAFREGEEELGVDFKKLTPDYSLIYSGPVEDYRETAHCWPETTAILIRPKNLKITDITFDPEEVKDVRLVPIDELEGVTLWHGAHGRLIDYALMHI